MGAALHLAAPVHLLLPKIPFQLFFVSSPPSLLLSLSPAEEITPSAAVVIKGEGKKSLFKVEPGNIK